ncbi:uncharacterized protein [Arachis hypogaea]|uniref:uncharacterized protein n=1 Tax=Arachis hypogaea TaxID=3818 RepID=UPI0010FC5C60|nr:uncharacterized protein LOC112750061 [Arachis hypogaea]
MVMKVQMSIQKIKTMTQRRRRLSHSMIRSTTCLPHMKLNIEAMLTAKKDTDFWKFEVIENGVIKNMDLTVKEALALPPGRKIILHHNKEMQQVGQSAGQLSGFLGSLGADFQQLPICEESLKTMNKAIKEHVFDQFKQVFHYEDDGGRRIKWRIIQRIGKNWKNTK